MSVLVTRRALIAAALTLISGPTAVTPTQAPPGSETKVRVLAARARRRLPLFVADDAGVDTLLDGPWGYKPDKAGNGVAFASALVLETCNGPEVIEPKPARQRVRQRKESERVYERQAREKGPAMPMTLWDVQLPDGRHFAYTPGHTKGEARAKVKAQLHLDRLPIGTKASIMTCRCGANLVPAQADGCTPEKCCKNACTLLFHWA